LKNVLLKKCILKIKLTRTHRKLDDFVFEDRTAPRQREMILAREVKKMQRYSSDFRYLEEFSGQPVKFPQN
jgi:hypothetical protein